LIEIGFILDTVYNSKYINILRELHYNSLFYEIYTDS